VLIVVQLAIPDFVVSFGWASLSTAVAGFRGAVLVMTLSVWSLVYLPVDASLRNADPGQEEVAGAAWRAMLGTWWPRLLPGVAAAATHGVIRVGQAARALLADGDDAVHVTELAHCLAYWAARWQPIPGAATGLGLPAADSALTPSAADALAAVPRIADQSGGVRERLGRLAGLPGCLPPWPRRAPGVGHRDQILAGRPGRRRRHQIPVLRARRRHHARALGDLDQAADAHTAIETRSVTGKTLLLTG
jgi:hypothetical protein